MKVSFRTYGLLVPLCLLVVCGAAQNGAALKSLTVEPGATLEIESDLNVADSACFRADAQAYSQVLGTVNGLSMYEIYLAADTARWFNLAFPVDTNLYGVGGIPLQATGNAANTTIWYYDAASDADTNGEGDFVPVDSMGFGTALKGFQVYAGDGVYTGTPPFTLRAAGRLVDGDVDISVSANTSAKFNLVPNPYPSTLDWQAVYEDPDNAGKLQATYYIQDGSINDSDYQYRYYNAACGEGDNGGTADIAPGQSLFVQVTDQSAGSISFKNSHRKLMGSPSLYRSQSPFDYLKLTAEHAGSGRKDHAFMLFGADLGDSLETVDALQLMNGGHPNLYTRLAGKDFLFNGISNQFTSRSVELHFQGDYPGSYSLAMSKDVIPINWTLQLEDKVTGAVVDLRNSGYSFNHAPGTAADRFVLHFNTSGVKVSENLVPTLYIYVHENRLYVKLTEGTRGTLQVSDIAGRLLSSRKGEGDLMEIDMNGWAQGVYFVNLSREGRSVFCEKVVIGME